MMAGLEGGQININQAAQPSTVVNLQAQVRVRLGALGRAFSQRSEEARTSHGAHRLALATLALQDALDQVAAAEQAQNTMLLSSTRAPYHYKCA